MFTNLTKNELKDIYADYCISTKQGKRYESIVPFAKKYTEKINVNMPLYLAIDIVTKEFFQEIAIRYFKI